MMWLLSILGAVVLALVARDAWGWLPRLSRGLVWLVTLPLPNERQAIRREEWAAELVAEFDERRLSGLLWTLTLGPISAWECLIAAITVDRRARLGSHRADARDAVIESRLALTIRVGAFVLGTGILTAQLLGALSSITPLLVIGVSLCGPVAAATLSAMADKLVAAR